MSALLPPATEVTVDIGVHSGHGHTTRHAEAVRQGIGRVPGAAALFLTSEEATARWEDLSRQGFFLGAAAQSNADQRPEPVPPAADLLTAAKLGENVALVAQQMACGRLAA